MAHTSSLETPETSIAQDISLLDLLVLLAENAKSLLLLPLLVGLLVWGEGAMRPVNFQSTAVLQTDLLVPSLVNTSTVLDPVARQMGLLAGETIEQARARLQQHVSLAVGRDKLLTLSVSAATPEQAQQLANLVLDQIYKASQPKDALRKRLEAQLLDARTQLRDAQTVASSMGRHLTVPAASPSRDFPDAGRAYADLLNVSAAARGQIQSLESTLDGVTSAQLLQAPTVAKLPSGKKKVLPALGAALGTGLFLLVLIVMRNAWRNLSADADSAEKILRIRRALGLKKPA